MEKDDRGLRRAEHEDDIDVWDVQAFVEDVDYAQYLNVARTEPA